jgi:hypothetical protein
MTTYQRTERDAKKAGQRVRKGQKLYVVLDVAQNLAPYEDAQVYSEYVVSYRHPLLGGWMISGSLSVEGLVLREGPVYTSPPKGIRNIAEPGRQYAAPLGNDYEGVLDEAELRGLDKRVRDGSDPRTRRSPRAWRI